MAVTFLIKLQVVYEMSKEIASFEEPKGLSKIKNLHIFTHKYKNNQQMVEVLA